MLRSVIQISDKTLVVSLPAEWTKKYKVSKGDSIEVEEKEAYLILTPDNDLGADKVSADITGLSPDTIKRLLGAIYKSGFDETELTFDSKEELDSVKKTLSISIKTFDIVDQKEGKLILKNLSDLRYEDFDQLMRRLFYLVLDNMKEAIASKNNPEKIEEVIERDLEINNVADFLRRSLNKKGYVLFVKTPPIYFIVEQLEKLGDFVRDIAKEMAKEDEDQKFISLLSESEHLLRKFYELYYTFDLKTLDAFLKSSQELKAKIGDSKSKKMMLLCAFVEQLSAMNGALLVAKL